MGNAGYEFPRKAIVINTSPSNPEKISDADAVLMAQQMKEKIEKELTYPGQIKVSVIREYRAVETAK